MKEGLLIEIERKMLEIVDEPTDIQREEITILYRERFNDDVEDDFDIIYEKMKEVYESLQI